MSYLINATPLMFVGQWATRSQEQARRNAMAACTVLAARRLERNDVEMFIADYLARRDGTGLEPAAATMRGTG